MYIQQVNEIYVQNCMIHIKYDVDERYIFEYRKVRNIRMDTNISICFQRKTTQEIHKKFCYFICIIHSDNHHTKYWTNTCVNTDLNMI